MGRVLILLRRVYVNDIPTEIILLGQMRPRQSYSISIHTVKSRMKSARQRNTVSTVRYGDGYVMALDDFSPPITGRFHIIERRKDRIMY